MTRPRTGGFARQAWMITLSSIVALVVLGVLLWSPWERPGIATGLTLRIYCAAGVTKPVEEIGAAYQQAYGVSIALDAGGSGEQLSKIEAAGGRGDLFLSAEAARMDDAKRKGFVVEVIPVGVLRPVLVVSRRTQEALTAAGKPVGGLSDLLRDDVQVLIAEQSASVGRMTRTILDPLGIWTTLEQRRGQGGAKVSTLGTVNQVAATVRTRDGSIGVVWSAIARQYPELVVIEPPEFAGHGERLELGVLAKSQNPTAALQFARFLTARDRGLPIFTRHHFDAVPDGDVWAERPEVHLSSGAMLKPGIDQTVKQFAQREGITINTTYQGCGHLVDQMKAMRRGDARPALFPDAYFACDTSFMEMVQGWFDTSIVIARNDMVLVVQKGNPKQVRSISDLARGELFIGLGHPRNSALGKLTDDMLKKLGLHERVYAGEWQKRIIHADAGHDLVNKMRAAAGKLDAAIVYRSNAISNPENPAKYLDVIDLGIAEAVATQPFAIARDSPHRYLMKRLLAAILSPQTEVRFRDAGFQWVYQPK